MDWSRRTFLAAGAAGAFSQANGAPGDRIAVGMIGAGARAHELMRAIQKHSGVEITAVADAYKGRTVRAVERTGGRARVYAGYSEMLADPAIDAVVVATPDHLHRGIILAALAAGKDVYAEKPLTFAISEGEEIVAAAARTQRIVQVGSQGVSSRLQQQAKEMIRSGKLGAVTMIRASYNRNTESGAWIYPIPPDASPETVDWNMFLGPAARRPFSLERFFRWRCYTEYSGGIATDLFVHLTTTIHYLMDAAMPDAVVALGKTYRRTEGREVPDTLNALLEYPEGFAVNLSSSFNSQSASGMGFFVMGTEGTLEIGWDTMTFHPENAREDNRWIVESWPKPLEDAYFRDPGVIARERTPKPSRQPEVIRGDGADPTIAHFGHFFASVRSRKPSWEDALAGHRAAACAHLVNQSVTEKRRVGWDPERKTPVL